MKNDAISKRIQKEKLYRYKKTISLFFLTISIIFWISSQHKIILFAKQYGLYQYIEPAFTSFRKISNAVHVAYWNKPSTLPVYHITVSTEKLDQLIEQKQMQMAGLNELALFTHTTSSVSARFVSEKDQYNEKISLSLLSAQDDWIGEKKAFRIEFPKKNLFGGASELTLLLPESRTYITELLHAYRAKKMGLISSNYQFVRLQINTRDFGVYLASEPWTPAYLARAHVYATDTIFLPQKSEDGMPIDLFSEEGKMFWKNKVDDESAHEINTLIDVTLNTDDETFAKKIPTMFDLTAFYQWQLLHMLAGSTGTAGKNDMILLFKKETGTFEPLVSHVGLYPLTSVSDMYAHNNLLARRILSNKRFFDEYRQTVAAYIHDKKNLQDDLAYYDTVYEQHIAEFYNDQKKHDTDVAMDRLIASLRDVLLENYSILQADKTTERDVGTLNMPTQSPVTFAGSFQYFDRRFESIDEFVGSHSEFTKQSNTTLVLSSGEHQFTKTTIIPEGIKLIIEPGSRLLFAPNVSFISFSPIIAEGIDTQEIYFGPLEPQSRTPWGVIAVLYDGQEKNKFAHVHVSSGSNDIINGIPLDGQLTLHNTTSEISDSLFEQAKSDDSVHVTAGTIIVQRSTFKNNTSDAIDFEFVHDAIIEHSQFFNDEVGINKGDGIDLGSSHNIILRDNTITHFADKGITAGEHSTGIVIDQLTVTHVGTGVGIKENSDATISNSTLAYNKTGLAAYKQKQEYVWGGSLIADSSVLWHNDIELMQGALSTLQIKNSTVEDGAEGVDISTSTPDLVALIK